MKVKWEQYIHVDPDILNGKPVIRNTRLAVEFIMDLLAEGWTFQQILDNYPALTAESLQAVFAFAAFCLQDDMFYALERKSS